MSHNHNTRDTEGNLAGLTPTECVRLLVEHRRTWLLPMAGCALLAIGYSLFMSRFWEATQGLMVRPEVSTSNDADLGKFADLYQMRTFQETILELAKSPQVIAATLKAVETAETGKAGDEPTASQIEELREHLSLLPPGGAEFGKTEVCYLQVKDTNRERALKLVTEFGKQIDSRLRALRTEKARSLSSELEQQVARAQATLEIDTQRLADFESQVGADLGELRMLNASYGGQSDLRQLAVRLNDERRAADIASRQAVELLSVLRSARQEPEQLIAMPTSLLISQPTLRRLKDGLVDAQLRAARLEGTRTANHPQVKAAKASVDFIRADLHNELEVAIRGVEVELHLGKNRAVKLEQQHQAVQGRLTRLAELRASYENHTSAFENSRQVLDQSQKRLGQVEVQLVAASSSKLITPIDLAETGPYPSGPGRATVVLVGAFGGLALGLGWLFLTVVPSSINPQDQRWAAEPSSNVHEGSATRAPVNTSSSSGGSQSPMPLSAGPSALPAAVSAKIAEILAARETIVTPEPPRI
ncbi:MAG: hypothetical protein AAGD11_15860 [Planctomycetota bacterium]